jgi:hypothetical protein
MNALCAIGDYSAQSDQPLMKHLKVQIVASPGIGRDKANGRTDH